MTYVGPAPKAGQNREVDDISSGFNGSTTDFTLQVGGSNVSPGSANNILVSVNNVVLNPSTAYTVNASTISFTSAPTNGQAFFGLVLGQGIDAVEPADGSVSAAKIAADAVITEKILDGNVTAAKLAADAITTAKIADQAVTLAKLPHGDSNNDGKFLRANNGADPSFETVNTDLVSDTSPQLGGTLLTAGHNIILTDTTGANNNRLVFGANTDMSIYHLPNNNYIDADTGTLHIRHSGETGAKFIKNGAVELYFDNVKKFETQSSGINVQGVNSYDAQIKIHGQPTIGRSYWGYGNNQSYTGTLVGRTDSSVASTIFMGVDVTGNGGGLFGGLGSEIVFRRNHIFTTPNAANNNFVTCMRFGRATSTEGAVAFTNGLMFGNDQADANIIDDYEEGTFTPVMKFGGSNTGMSVGSMAGIYTKIGRMVHIVADVEYASSPADSSQVGYLTGLPFTNGDKSVHQHLPWFGSSAANDNQFFNTYFTPLIFASDDKFSFLNSNSGTYLTRAQLASKKVRINSTYYTSY